MTMRSTTQSAARQAQTGISRSTIREVNDDHLCQEVKHADVMHSETPSDFEMWHPLGMTSVCMKQKDDQSQQGQQGQGGQGGGGNGGGGGDGHFNKNQPKGESAEAMMLYVNGQRAHPVAMINDRRVRPYGLKEGEAAMYSPDGSGQMMYHRVRGDSNDGLYILTCDDQAGSSGGSSSGGGAQALAAGTTGGQSQQSQKRYISVRHVEKPKQRRKKSQQGQSGGSSSGGGASAQALAADGGGGASSGGASGGGGQQQGLPDDSKSNYKHEGQTVNTEQRFTSQQIQYYDGDTNVGHYDRGNKDWLHHDGNGASHSMRADQNHSHIKHDGAHCWMEGGCFHSIPWVIKPDGCK